MAQDLPSQLRTAATRQRVRAPGCPDEHELAAYVDGTLDESACERLETHLADCDSCVALVGLLSRQREVAPDAVPELTAAPASPIVDSRRRGWLRFAPHIAAAAAVLVTISALTNLLQLQVSGVDPQNVSRERTTRSSAEAAPELHVLYPTAGITIEADQLRFRWSAVEGSRYYEVHIVSDSGDLIREERVFGTEWRPVDQLNLRPGAEYFVQIDAYPADAKTVSSAHVPFWVATRR